MTVGVATLLSACARMEAMPLVEQPDGSNHVPYVTSHYGIDPGPWCAMGVSRAFELAGFVEAVAFSTARGFAYCPSGIAGFRARGQWHAGPAGMIAGDVLFFDWEHDGEADHVGIAMEPFDGSRVRTWECNRDNRCEYGFRGGANIVGYGRPAYASSTPQPKPQPPNEGSLFVTLKPEEEQEILAAARVVNKQVAAPKGSGGIYEMVTDTREDGAKVSAIDHLRELVVRLVNKDRA